MSKYKNVETPNTYGMKVTAEGVWFILQLQASEPMGPTLELLNSTNEEPGNDDGIGTIIPKRDSFDLGLDRFIPEVIKEYAAQQAKNTGQDIIIQPIKHSLTDETGMLEYMLAIPPTYQIMDNKGNVVSILNQDGTLYDPHITDTSPTSENDDILNVEWDKGGDEPLFRQESPIEWSHEVAKLQITMRDLKKAVLQAEANGIDLKSEELKRHFASMFDEDMLNISNMDLAALKDIDLGTYGQFKEGVDGKFGKLTEKSLMTMQRALGFKVDFIDGVCEPGEYEQFRDVYNDMHKLSYGQSIVQEANVTRGMSLTDTPKPAGLNM
jgi:hypothetical protein